MLLNDFKSNKGLAKRVSHHGDLRKKKITQADVDEVLVAFADYIFTELVNNKEFSWRNVMNLNLVEVAGHNVVDFEGEKVMLDSYFKMYAKPSEDLKKKIKEILR